MHAQIGKEENNKFYVHNSLSRKGKYFTDFSLENRLTCLNTKFQKMGWKTMDLHQPKYQNTDRLLIYKQEVDT